MTISDKTYRYNNNHRENESSEEDTKKMVVMCRKYLGYGGCVGVAGIIYLEGRGTVKNPPCSVHTIAKLVCKQLNI